MMGVKKEINVEIPTESAMMNLVETGFLRDNG